MGESSTKQLRSSNSSDVIFAGTKDVKQKNICEVEIIFNNSDKKHPLPHEQISVKRKFLRNGDNNYFINNNKVRQKDVVNFFLELGISKTSLLMVNQGKIDSFINMSGKDRAKLIEQVAQVAIFEERKKESITKLNRASENILRLNDILDEKQQTYNILEKSASKAIEYKNVTKVLDQHLFLKVNFELSRDNELLIKNKEQYKNLINKKYQVNELINAQNLQIEDFKLQTQTMNKNINSYNDQIIELNSREEKLKYEIKEKKLIASNSISQIEFQLKQHGEEINSFQSALNKLDEEVTSFKDKQKEAQANKENIAKSISKINSLLFEKKSESDKLNNIISKNKFELKNLEDDLHYRDLKKIKTDISFKSVKDCLSINKDFEVIVFDVLANNVKNLVTKTSNEAKNLLNYISNNRLSKISIYPMDNLKPKYNNVNLSKVLSCTGVIAHMCDVVDVVSSEYANLINYLFTNIIIVDNIENANKINNKFKNSFTFVTKDLKYIYPSGIFSGGQNKFSLSNKVKRINELKENVNNSESKLLQNQHVINDCNEKFDKLSKLSQQNFELVIKFTTNLEEKLARKNEITSSLKSLNRKVEDLNLQLSKFDKKSVIDENNDQIELIKTEINKCKSLKIEAQNSLDEISEKFDNLRVKKDENQKLISTINLDLPVFEQKIEKLTYNINVNNEKLNAYKSDFDVNIKSYDQNEINKLQTKLRSIGSVDFDVIEEFEKISREINEYKTNINDVSASIDKIKKAISELEKQSNDRFEKFFVEIRANFKKYFKYIFVNGHCDLKLETIDNCRHIDVIASTKGSAHNLVSLLSGGEKALTIIALLFAILKVSDFSFVILDEIEAALDENNVDKIARILTDFAKSTQIISITHRRGTMKQADVLYGISHGIVGVSQAIKIKLGEENEFSKEVI